MNSIVQLEFRQALDLSAEYALEFSAVSAGRKSAKRTQARSCLTHRRNRHESGYHGRGPERVPLCSFIPASMSSNKILKRRLKDIIGHRFRSPSNRTATGARAILNPYGSQFGSTASGSVRRQTLSGATAGEVR